MVMCLPNAYPSPFIVRVHHQIRSIHSIWSWLTIFHKVTSQSDTTTLLGSSRRDYYDILKWMSFANSDFLLSIGGCILPLIGRVPFIRLNSSDSLIALHQHCKLTDDHLRTNRYLVGERATIADIFVAATLIGAYMVLHKMVQPKYPFMTRWFYEIYNMPMFKDVAGDLVLLDLPITSLPGKEDNLTYGDQAEAQHAAGTVGA